ncbi:MAG: DivIVA domain-containing protein [Vicinamibacterales bacterium]
MNVSPLELRQQKFSTAFRGFDPVEVGAFLTAVADDYENAVREADRLRQELARMEGQLKGHLEQEKSLQSALIMAQKMADTIKAGAEEQASRIIREAEIRSESLLAKSQARLEDIQREIDGLKLKRRDVEMTLEASISALHNTLDFVRDQDAREREDLFVYTAPPVTQQEASAG